jgi:hypothetical protein
MGGGERPRWKGPFFGRTGTAKSATHRATQNVLRPDEQWIVGQAKLLFTGGHLVAAMGVSRKESGAERGVIVSWPLNSEGLAAAVSSAPST